MRMRKRGTLREVRAERARERRSLTATKRGVYIRYLIRDLRSTLNEMNAFTCLLRAYLGASIRPFISSAPLPFSGWLPFLRSHHGVPITLSLLPPLPPSALFSLWALRLVIYRMRENFMDVKLPHNRNLSLFIDLRGFDNKFNILISFIS